MKDEPEIVKELKEAEKLEGLQSKVQNAYEKLEVVEEPSQEDIPDKSIGFVEDDVEKNKKLTVNRELRMAELKGRIEELEGKLGKA